MYNIEFYSDDRLCEVVGGKVAVINLAHILQASHTEFKVSGFSGEIPQETFGLGTMTYWLAPGVSFGEVRDEKYQAYVDKRITSLEDALRPYSDIDNWVPGTYGKRYFSYEPNKVPWKDAKDALEGFK